MVKMTMVTRETNEQVKITKKEEWDAGHCVQGRVR
jgi:hypothetical protein